MKSKNNIKKPTMPIQNYIKSSLVEIKSTKIQLYKCYLTYIRQQKNRKRTNMYESYEKHVRFAWKVCQTNRLVPPRICDVFIKEMQAVEPEHDHKLLSEPELILYREETPTEQEMIDIVYSLAYRELYETLKVIDDDSYNRISDQYILVMRSNMNIHHSFVYDLDKSFSQQGYLKTTRIMIRYLFEHFWNDADDDEAKD